MRWHASTVWGIVQAGGQCQEAAQSRLYQNSCSFSTLARPHLVSESMQYIPSGCCENIMMIYTGLQLSLCIILDVWSEKLSHLQKKPHPNNKNQTNQNNKPTHNLLWGQKDITWSHEEEVHGQALCGTDMLSLSHVAHGPVNSPWTCCDLQYRYMLWRKMPSLCLKIISILDEYWKFWCRNSAVGGYCSLAVYLFFNVIS